MPGAIIGLKLFGSSRVYSINEVCLGMEDEILKESRLDCVDAGLPMGAKVVSEWAPSLNCWFSLVS